MSDMSEERYEAIFKKLDTINTSLTEFKVEVAKGFGSLPCGAHQEAIKGFRAKIVIVTTLLAIILSGVVALAFKSFA